MKFGSVCSGIEAASVAWHPLGWEAAWLSEIEPFPCAVLKHHYPDVPNHGDMTLLPEKILSGEVEAPDLFCGGTPCQAFSVAGLRNSLDDARGNLSLTFVGIANAIDHVRSVRRDAPAIIFWENVPGVLNTKDNAFGCFLGALAGESDQIVPPGEKWTNAGCVFGPTRTVAWRVLDAQYFGVAQRRRRVFVVASARKDINPTEILFESEGVRRDTAPSRKEGKVTPTISSSGTGVSRVGFNCEDEWFIETPVVGALDTECGGSRLTHQSVNNGHLLSTFTPSSIGGYREGVGTLRANGGDVGGGSENLVAARMVSFGEYSVDGTASAMKARDWKDATDLVAQPVAFHPTQDPITSIDGTTHGLGCGSSGGQASIAVAQPMAFDLAQITSAENRSRVSPELPASTLAKNSDMHIASTMAVRRLTPTECERLQGFPDNYTNIPWRKASESPDGPRYKALGNSWAVPVVRWIGKRIQEAINAA